MCLGYLPFHCIYCKQLTHSEFYQEEQTAYARNTLSYNSATFSTLSANDYDVLLVNNEWLSDYIPEDDYNGTHRDIWDAQRAGAMQRLEPKECIEKYAKPFVSSRRHVILVSITANSSVDDGSRMFDSASGGAIHITGAMDAENLDPYPWMCDTWEQRRTRGFCDIDTLGLEDDDFEWHISNRTVQYCLSESSDEHCKLRLSITIAILVSILNLLKSVLILFVAFRVKDEMLLNMGDAVASFLRRPDPITEGSCLLTRDEAAKLMEKGPGHAVPWGPKVFHDKRRRWFNAVSRRRLLTVLLSSFGGILLCMIFLVYGLHSMPGASPSDFWNIGFGQATEHTLITFAGIRRRMIRAQGTLSNVLIANSGQAVLSFLYFTCNGLLTTMFLSHEWSSYAIQRKGLRVSSKPHGQQRSTYFLQLPFRYAIPMMICGTVLHWLASQSIFLIAVEQWTNEFRTREWVHDDFWDFATCAWSPMALLIFIVVAALLMLVLVALSFRRFKSGMPVAGSCSLAIAAACHSIPDYEPELVERLRLQWGIIPASQNGTEVARSAFSGRDVEYLREGMTLG